ncbi:MAG TPA: hypothetical protein VLC09_03410, partial [Polyangiaceae bacterium]|nr:hypothetical protein [Polyangiaceae bacterium]
MLPVVAALLSLGCDVDAMRERVQSGAPSVPSAPPIESRAALPPPPAQPSRVVPPPGAPRSFADLAAEVDPAVVFVHRKEAQRFTDGIQVYERKVDSGSGSGFVFDAKQG